MITYEQQTGVVAHKGVNLGVGYSGCGIYKNNPKYQNVLNKGPIPRGIYIIEAPFDSKEMGPFALPLMPGLKNKMFARSGFAIHGDTLFSPGNASQGCIILSRALRQLIWDLGDRMLEVV